MRTVSSQEPGAVLGPTDSTGAPEPLHHGDRHLSVRARALIVTLLAALFYVCWLVTAFASGHTPRTFIDEGTKFLTQAHSSSVIKFDPRRHYSSNRLGYDGQFYYYMALDPVHAHDYVGYGNTDAAYRYTRIVYPMLARILALGRVDWIPLTLILVNLVSIILGTLALALWLARKGVSPWFALVLSACPGVFISLQRDLADAVGLAFLASGLYFLDFGGRRRTSLAAGLFMLAVLTRETYAVFVGVFVLFEALRERDWRRPLLLAAFAGIPFLAWKLFLLTWLGSVGNVQAEDPVLVPFSGLTSHWSATPPQIGILIAVVIPGVICLAAAIVAVARGAGSREVFLLLVAVTLFVVLLNSSSYKEIFSASRPTASVILAAILTLPSFAALSRWGSAWIWVCTALWLLPTAALWSFYS